MPATTATTLEWNEIIPDVFHCNLQSGMTAEIIKGFRDSWGIYDYSGDLIVEGYNFSVPACQSDVSRVLRSL